MLEYFLQAKNWYPCAILMIDLLRDGTPCHCSVFSYKIYNFSSLFFHRYIHSFRFAQAQNVMKMFPWAYFFFIILLVGNSVYYKSRGGEWAVRLAGWPYCYMCRLSFQAQISVTPSTKSYLCLNNFVYGLDSQSIPSLPIIFSEPLRFWKESLWL